MLEKMNQSEGPKKIQKELGHTRLITNKFNKLINEYQ